MYFYTCYICVGEASVNLTSLYDIVTRLSKELEETKEKLTVAEEKLKVGKEIWIGRNNRNNMALHLIAIGKICLFELHLAIICCYDLEKVFFKFVLKTCVL